MVWRRARRLRWRASRAGDKETDTRLDGEVGWLGPIVAAANCRARIWSQVGRREQVARRCHLLPSIRSLFALLRSDLRNERITSKTCRKWLECIHDGVV